jgi:hypothetical protein
LLHLNGFPEANPTKAGAGLLAKRNFGEQFEQIRSVGSNPELFQPRRLLAQPGQTGKQFQIAHGIVGGNGIEENKPDARRTTPAPLERFSGAAQGELQPGTGSGTDMRKSRAKLHGGAHLLLPLKRRLIQLLRVPMGVTPLEGAAEFLDRARHVPRPESRKNQRLAGEIRERVCFCGIQAHIIFRVQPGCKTGQVFGSTTSGAGGLT